ncbi:MAG: hypothetical protein AAGJ97_07835, partial [Planctomycetota bacterium]
RQLDPFGAETDARAWAQGPGLTVDEMFNVQEGARLSFGLRMWALGAVSWGDVWRDAADYGPGEEAPLGYHLADHPPLGRVWLGVWHDVSRSIWNPYPDRPRFTALDARLGSAVAFALTVLLVTRFTRKRAGPIAGFAAGLALVLMPRPFGHAHIAALETVTNLATTAVILHVAGRWKSEPERSREGTKKSAVARPFASRLGLLLTPAVPWTTAAGSGGLWGVAMLTKIQAVLLVPPLVMWALWRFRFGAVVPLAIAATAGAVVFFVGWPWLWLDPAGHLVEYFGRTTDRVPIRVLYFGTVYEDVDVPWHYPWVMTGLTTPWALLGLAVVPLLTAARSLLKGEPRGVSPGMGPVKSERNGSETADVPRVPDHPGTDAARLADRGVIVLLALAVLLPLAVFSRPGTPVYDGCRLFLIVFPLVAVLAGQGLRTIASLVFNAEAKSRMNLAVGLGSLAVCCVLLAGPPLPSCWCRFPLALGGVSVRTSWVGGPLPPHDGDYWGHAVTGRLTRAAAAAVGPDGRFVLEPHLHPFQSRWLSEQSPLLRKARISAIPPEDAADRDGRVLLRFDRRAYLPDQKFVPERDRALLAGERTVDVPGFQLLAGVWDRRGSRADDGR